MSIFVQIAAYRDPLLASTIRDLIDKAERPDMLKIVVCNQYHPEDDFNEKLNIYREDNRLKFIDVPYNEAKGVCWARNLIQQEYKSETYTLQIDSHMRFIEKWDTVLKEMLEALIRKDIKKPILTTYPPHFDPEDSNTTDSPPNRILLYGFHDEGVPFTWPDIIPEWEKLVEPVPARFFAGGFSFAQGRLCEEVPHDPNLYFGGEEINIMLRAFTRGYDFFHPHINIAWHYYSRADNAKHWTDHPASVTAKLNSRAYYRLERLFDNKNKQTTESWGIYGLGKERSLRDYEKFAGILLHEKKMQEFAFKNFPPPGLDTYTSENAWLNSFFYHFKETLKIPSTYIKENDYNNIVLSFSANNETVHQFYMDSNQIIEMLEIRKDYKINVEFLTKVLPDSWVLSLHSISKGWSKPIKMDSQWLDKRLNKFSINGCSVL